MRHRKKINHLGRTTSHRKAMLSNMANSLIIHKRITTTTAKAKALRLYVEPLITKSKDDSTHSRRVVFSYLQDKHAVSELFREISPKITDRPGGYTRILKTGTRLGDSADMCIIELVDYNENLLTAKGDAKGKSSRRRRKSSKPKAEVTATEATTEVVETVEEVKDAPVEKVSEASVEEATEVKAEETTDTPEAKTDKEEKKEE